MSEYDPVVRVLDLLCQSGVDFSEMSEYVSEIADNVFEFPQSGDTLPFVAGVFTPTPE